MQNKSVFTRILYVSFLQKMLQSCGLPLLCAAGNWRLVYSMWDHTTVPWVGSHACIKRVDFLTGRLSVACKEMKRKKLNDICERLRKCDYPEWMLNRATGKVKQKSRKDLLKYWPTSDISHSNRPTFVTTYSSEFFAIRSIIKNTCHYWIKMKVSIFCCRRDAVSLWENLPC